MWASEEVTDLIGFRAGPLEPAVHKERGDWEIRAHSPWAWVHLILAETREERSESGKKQVRESLQ